MDQDNGELGTILVPLDGSALAERALPVAERLALALRGNVLLARVIPLMTWTTMLATEATPVAPEVYQRLVDDEDRMAREYLAKQADSLRGHDLLVRTCAARGEPASTLIALESQEQVGLVVMTTHGRTGMARFALGSVADRLVCAGDVPVLVLRSFGQDDSIGHMERALIPLDGSARAERALVLTRRLAGSVVKRALVVRVVAEDATPDEKASAQRYLDEVYERQNGELSARGCALTTELLSGDTAGQIVERAEADRSAVILVTHGRSGPARWALGSIADRMVHASTTPTLLIRSA